MPTMRRDVAAKLMLLVSCVGSAAIGGVCFAFASFIMQALHKLDASEAIKTMQEINTTILTSATIVVWMAMVLVGIAAAVLADGSILSVLAALAYTTGAVLITGLGNVPLNNHLASVDVDDDDTTDLQEVWNTYSEKWGVYNVVRTVLFFLAALSFALDFGATCVDVAGSHDGQPAGRRLRVADCLRGFSVDTAARGDRNSETESLRGHSVADALHH